MGHISTHSTDPEVLKEIGLRLQALRRSRDLTLGHVAGLSGLSEKTVSRAEHGLNPTTLTVVRLLRVYERLTALNEFVPEPAISPMALIRERRSEGTRG
ncbi:MAG: helix-turn-helix transcriptional regulator [Gemmatimonadetes bacterium]|nr:helix-turn-helix transcriptional regulator [Gemmatimonadota bacterium]